MKMLKWKLNVTLLVFLGSICIATAFIQSTNTDLNDDNIPTNTQIPPNQEIVNQGSSLVLANALGGTKKI
mgnify:FL=1